MPNSVYSFKISKFTVCQDFRTRALRLLTIYKKKLVGTRFVQMVSKNSRMGNLVGIGVYHLQNSFNVTKRVWREAKSWGYANGKHVFRLGILDYHSRNPIFSRNFLFGKTRIGLPFTFQLKFPDFCGKW